MKVVRDYLTSQELNYIVNAMLEKKTALEREVVKVALVAQLVCEEIGDFDDCNDVYDKVVADSKINFSEIINNYNIIDKIYAEETGINKILKDFVDNINIKLDNATKNMDLNGAINQLKEIANSHNEILEVKPTKGGKNGIENIQTSSRNRKKS
jgi:hypothetical protein